jgi:hypothetical protein
VQFLEKTVSLHDQFGNRVFSVLGPLLFLYAGVYHFFGEKIAQLLLKRDQFLDHRICIRPYFVLRSIIIVGVFCWSIAQALWIRGTAQLIICIILLMGYSGIFIYEPCAINIQYTSEHILIRRWRTEYKISMCNISRMSWERVSRSFDYALVIYTDSGRKIVLHSAYYVGLNRLRAIYDAQQAETQ